MSRLGVAGAAIANGRGERDGAAAGRSLGRQAIADVDHGRPRASVELKFILLQLVNSASHEQIKSLRGLHSQRNGLIVSRVRFSPASSTAIGYHGLSWNGGRRRGEGVDVRGARTSLVISLPLLSTYSCNRECESLLLPPLNAVGLLGYIATLRFAIARFFALILYSLGMI